MKKGILGDENTKTKKMNKNKEKKPKRPVGS
jgi:hypothetical protein